jgi:hypothetical protein
MSTEVVSRTFWKMRAFYWAWPGKRFSRPCQENLQSPFPPGLNVASLGHSKHRRPAFPLPWSAYVRLLSVRKQRCAGLLRNGSTAFRLVRSATKPANRSQFYERIALSKNKASMLEKAERAEPGDAITPEEAIKSPFLLEFLDLKDEYSESELEDAGEQRYGGI